MENQHRKITGYRELTQEEIDLMNTIKGLSETCGKMIEELRKHESLDQRWISIGQTDLQKGFMAVIRGIARPESF